MAHIQLQWTNITQAEDKGQMNFSLPVNIGRAPGNDLVLADDQASVSRKHACLKREQDDIVLSDCHSTNGVYIDQKKISKTAIKNGTNFRLGVYELTLTLQHRCSNDACQKLVDSQASLCPWCGRFLTDAITKETLFG